MNEPLFLTIDYGTQSVRAMLFDLKGELVAKSQVPLDRYVYPQDGWVEYRPSDYWAHLCDACQRLKAEHEHLFQHIVSASLTTQRGTQLWVDEQGRALRNAIVWLDQREVVPPPLKTPAGKVMSALSGLVGAGETFQYLRRQAESNWVRVNQRDKWQQTAKVLTLSGFLTRKLVGRFVDSYAAQVGYFPFDYRRLRYPMYNNWRCDAVGISPEQLPEVVAPGTLLGAISAEAARDTGLPENMRWYAAAGDKACEILGAGCLEESIGCLSYGTTATINTTSTRYLEPIALLPSYPAAIPNHYTTEVSIYRGYWMVSWFLAQFGQVEMQASHEQGCSPESLLDQLASDVPIGSDGLVVLPYWSPGIRVPGPEARGAVIGFTDKHTRAHVYRAILEGIAFGLKEGSARIVAKSKVPLRELRVSGGGAQSDVAMQLSADIFGIPAIRPHTTETSGLGAAICAAVGASQYSTFPAAIAAMTRLGSRFEPVPSAVKIYQYLYEGVFRDLYPKLQPLYQKLHARYG